MFDKIAVSTTKLLQCRFQAFLDVSLSEKLIWKSCRPQNETFIWGASPGVSYNLLDKDAIGGRSWYIATQEHIWLEIGTIVMFLWKTELFSLLFSHGNWNLHVCHEWKYEDDRPSRSTEVNPGKKQKWCSLSCLWFKFNGIHLAKVILKLWVVYGQNIIDVPICEIEQRCKLFPAGWE